MKPPAKSPCGSCPYRKDVPSGVWHESEYAKLPEFDRVTYEQPMATFGCHQNDGRACGGWVATHNMEETLGFRIAVSRGHIAEEDVDAFLDYETHVDLFASGQEAADHGMRDIEDPGERAGRIISKVSKIPGVTRG